MPSPDYQLDIAGVQPPQRRVVGQPRSSLHGRPWIAVQWDCCGAYSRIYRNADATAYVGKCPRCARQVQVKVGPGGTDNRFFVAR